MSIVMVTGSGGLIGSQAVEFYARLGYMVIGIDNNMREQFFGADGSTRLRQKQLEEQLGSRYLHIAKDIRNTEEMSELFKEYNADIQLIIHTAAQPSHDWAARDPHVDFGVNAVGTLNLLENMRQHCPDSVFIYMSTNKVYGDKPNTLPLVREDMRWEIHPDHPYQNGIPEALSIDQSMHSLFGVSKLAADVLVQEYGKYFNLKTVSFRGGVLTGPNQAGVKLHGFITYLMKCVITKVPYTIFGYEGRQVRDVIHASDVIAAFHAFFKSPRSGGEVYNLGGGRHSNISVLEAIDLAEEITGSKLNYQISNQARAGDHIWYVSDLSKWHSHYPTWRLNYDVRSIMEEIYQSWSVTVGD